MRRLFLKQIFRASLFLALFERHSALHEVFYNNVFFDETRLTLFKLCVML